VLYLPEPERWHAIAEQVRALGAREVPAANPYWNERGVTFEDPDRYRVVLQNAAWP
jgi:hypothetical protein